jgi:hypothetical protein
MLVGNEMFAIHHAGGFGLICKLAFSLVSPPVSSQPSIAIVSCSIPRPEGEDRLSGLEEPVFRLAATFLRSPFEWQSSHKSQILYWKVPKIRKGTRNALGRYTEPVQQGRTVLISGNRWNKPALLFLITIILTTKH